MGVGNILLLSQTVAFVILFILTWFIFIPLSVNNHDFHGHCLLFAEGHWENQQLNISSWGNPGFCRFAIFVGAFSFPMSLFFIVLFGLYLYKDNEPSWLEAFFTLLYASLSTVFVLVSAIFLSAGLNAWCLLVQEQYPICSLTDVLPLKIEQDIDTLGFYDQISIAQFGCWTSWLCWVFLTGCSSYQLYMYHRQEHFFSSMSRERERLIQRVRNEPSV